MATKPQLPSYARDRIVKIESRPVADGTGGSGFPVDTWTTLVSEQPAAKIDASGSERFRAAQTSAEYSTRWQINYRLDMDPDLVDVPKLRRIVHQTRIYDITSAVMLGRREVLELYTVAHG